MYSKNTISVQAFFVLKFIKIQDAWTEINVLKENKNVKIFQTLLSSADSNSVQTFFVLKFIKIQVAWTEMLSFFFLNQTIVQ